MPTFKNLILGLFLLLQLHCSHTGVTTLRGISNDASKDCQTPLSGLAKKQELKNSRAAADKKTSSREILPPAETKLLEPLAPQNFESFSQERKLKVATYNVLNLKEMVGRFEPNPATGKRIKTKPEKAKAQEAIDGVAAAIKEISPDILFLQEVEGLESLGAFATRELENQWRPLIMKGNDGRGIHIGVLVKNSVPLSFEYRSHRDEPFSSDKHPDLQKVFSRDFPVLIAKSPSDHTPLFILAGVHGKSKRTDNHSDPESREIRTAQAERMVDIIQFYQEKYPNIPILLLGDFNAEPSREPEYQALRDFNLKDAFDLIPNPLPTGSPERITHTFHPQEGSRKASQLDSILIVPPIQNIVLDAKVYRYKNPDGSIKPLPQTYEEREQNPSDHFPIWADLDLQKLLGRTHRN